MSREPVPPPRPLSPVQLRNGIAHRLRGSMAHGRRVNIKAGRYSCMGMVIRLEKIEPPPVRPAEDESTLQAIVNPGEGFENLTVPVSAIREVELC